MVLAVLKLFSIVELTGEKCKGNRACVHCVRGEQLALLVPSFRLFGCLCFEFSFGGNMLDYFKLLVALFLVT